MATDVPSLVWAHSDANVLQQGSLLSYVRCYVSSEDQSPRTKDCDNVKVRRVHRMVNYDFVGVIRYRWEVVLTG